MSLLVSRIRGASLRSSLGLLCNGFSSSSLLQVQTPPCFIFDAYRCGNDLGTLVIGNAYERGCIYLEKKVPLELVNKKEMVTIGSSHGWVATLKDDGIVRLQDDLNPLASGTDPKRILLPPLVTLPRCQTKIVTSVSMSSSSPEDKDCVVAVKFLGPQLSVCSNSEWANVRIQNHSFFSNPVMFSKKTGMFCIPASGGHLIGSWDPHKLNKKPKIQRLRFKNLPELTKTRRQLLDSCCTSEHLVESRSTGETFLVKSFRKAIDTRTVKLKTEGVMVFRLDEQGNAVYTQDIGDVHIFLSKSEPFCVLASSFPGLASNYVEILDVDERTFFDLEHSKITRRYIPLRAPYYIPPQNIV